MVNGLIYSEVYSLIPSIQKTSVVGGISDRGNWMCAVVRHQKSDSRNLNAIAMEIASFFCVGQSKMSGILLHSRENCPVGKD